LEGKSLDDTVETAAALEEEAPVGGGEPGGAAELGGGEADGEESDSGCE